MMMVGIWDVLSVSSFMFLNMMMSLTVTSSAFGMSSLRASFFRSSESASEL